MEFDGVNDAHPGPPLDSDLPPIIVGPICRHAPPHCVVSRTLSHVGASVAAATAIFRQEALCTASIPRNLGRYIEMRNAKRGGGEEEARKEEGEEGVYYNYSLPTPKSTSLDLVSILLYAKSHLLRLATMRTVLYLYDHGNHANYGDGYNRR